MVSKEKRFEGHRASNNYYQAKQEFPLVFGGGVLSCKSDRCVCLILKKKTQNLVCGNDSNKFYP